MYCSNSRRHSPSLWEACWTPVHIGCRISALCWPTEQPSPQAAAIISFYSGWNGVLVSKLRGSGTPVESGSEEENQQLRTFCLNEFIFVCPLQKTKCPHPQFLSMLALQRSSPPVLASLSFIDNLWPDPSWGRL